jgi:vitamin-K-epoxide reductase (warfarin-sensitive)
MKMLNRLLRLLIASLAIAGLVVSVLALRIHNSDPNDAPPCAVTEKWDCGTVNHGKYSVFPALTVGEEPNSGKLHIPVAEIGIAGYALLFLLAIFGYLRIVLPMAAIGCCCAGYLTYIEAYVITKWCIYCVWSQTIIATLLITTIVALIVRSRTQPAAARA